MKVLVFPLCMLTQMACFLLYCKVGSNYQSNTPEAYNWGVFYHVSNQLFTSTYILLIPFGKRLFYDVHTKIFFWLALSFNLILTLIYANSLLPGGSWVVHNVNFIYLFGGYLFLCLVVYYLVLRFYQKLDAKA